LVVGLAWTGLAQAQSSSQVQSATSPPKARHITVREEGKPPLRCRVLKTWRQPNGSSAYQVQAVETGEMLTIVSSEPSNSGEQKGQALLTRIFHWGANTTPPAGAPVPPSSSTVSRPAPMPQLTVKPTALPNPQTQSNANKPAVAQNSTVSPQPRLVPTTSGAVPYPSTCNNCCPPSCNACCQQSCVCGTSSPLRQSWIGRLFKSNSSCDAVACQPAPTAPAGAAKPAATPVAKAATDAPQPGDWRESWGKVEPWKSAPQADAAKRVTNTPAKLDPPKQPDPLKDPAWYGETALKQKPANSKIPEEKAERPTADKPAAARSTPNPPPPQTASAPVVAPPTSPTGRVAHLPDDGGANAFTPAAPPPSPTRRKFNAFDREENDPPRMAGPAMGPMAMTPSGMGPMAMAQPAMGPMAMAQPAMGPMPMPMPPRPPMPPPMVDGGVPSNMGNAFTLAGTRRPIPADFGGTPQEPNGFGDAVPQMAGQGSPPRPYVIASSGMMSPRQPMMVNPLMNVPPSPAAYGAPAMSTAYGPPAMPAAYGAPAMTGQPTGVWQLLATLKESMYPSQREWAAEQLSELNWHTQPLVVESLTKSAREDLAATVRAASVRALGHMKVNTYEVVTLVRDLKNDRDSRVRREADEVLSALDAALHRNSGVQQASHK
jgi:hypothetical protein